MRIATTDDGRRTTDDSVRRADAFRFTLPLVRPLPLVGAPLTARRGLLLRLESTAGAVGWGEAAPLPGFSRETADDAAEALRSLLPILTGPPSYLFDTACPPSARFAVRSALWHLASAQAGSLPETLPRVVRVNGLLVDGLAEAVLASAGAMAEAGFRAVKFKLARRPVAEDIALVRALVETLGPTVALRLDANRRWAFDEAVHFAEAVRGVPLAYVEEPLNAPERLPELVEKTGLPVALDESVRDMNPEDLAAHGYARAVVLKPGVLGEIERTLAFIAQARTLGMQPVLSSSFESGVGMVMLGELAVATGLADVPAGFDTYRYLARDVLSSHLRIENGFFHLPDAIAINEDLLEPLYSEDRGAGSRVGRENALRH